MARKSYTDELAGWVKQREATRPRQDKSLVAFLAVRVDVTAAVSAGYAIKTIWEHLHATGRIACRYETFLRHVRRHIKRTLPHEQPDPPAPRPTDGKPAGCSLKKELPAVAGFSYDPRPNKEDLF